MQHRRMSVGLMAAAAVSISSAVLIAQAARGGAATGAAAGQWRSYGGDTGFQRYSPLAQIDKNNVARLQIAWRRPAVDDSVRKLGIERPTGVFESSPVMIDGVLYASNGVGVLEAFDPTTGKTLWVQESPWRDNEPAGGRNLRSISYWRGAGADPRLLSVAGRYLVATDPKTGKLIRNFGDGGRTELGVYADSSEIVNYQWGSSPLVIRDVVVLGSQVPRKGDVRAYDVKTGKLRWTFNVIPRKGEPGFDTWLNDSSNGIQGGEADVWTSPAGDEELGLIYLPTSAATNNMYGGHRPGNNLYSSSLICVRAETGERVWHFQTVHHDIYDYDNATPPILADLRVDGKPIKAVILLTKQAMVFAFDRVTGKPIWPIEERPIPKSTAPGEWTSPTQPFPTKPAAFDRQGISMDDLIDFTPQLRAEAEAIARGYVLGPLYTPPSVAGPSSNPTRGTLQMPGQVGGANWLGGSFDPETGMLYVPSVTGAFRILLSTEEECASDAVMRAEVGWRCIGGATKTGQNYRGIRAGVEGPQGLPLTKPPYGRITAINMNTGEHVWMVPNGDGPRNHPLLKHLNLPPLGQTGRAGTLVTKTLLFVSEGDQSMRDMPPGSGPDAGRKIRAFDKATGAVVWEMTLDAGTNGAPITYLANGKQYIVMPIGSRSHTQEWIALSLP